MDTSRAHRVRFLIDLAYWAAILGVLCLALKFLRLALPLLLAFAIAAAVRPVSRFLSRETRIKRGKNGERLVLRRRIRINAGLAGALSVLALFALLGALAATAALRAANALSALVSSLPGFFEKQLAPGVEALYQRLIAWSGRIDPDLAEALSGAAPELIASLGRAVTGASGRAVGALTSFAAALPGMLLTTMITAIAAVFIAVDYDRLKLLLRQNLPAKPLHYCMTVRNSFVDMAGRFARSYLIILLITAAENILGLWWIGVRQPVLLGLLIGVVDVFPVVGSGTVLIPWACACLLTGETLRGGELLALYALITIARQLMEPRIIGRRVGLRPIVTLGCMYLGGRSFGAVGLFALPIMAAILADLNSSGVIRLFRRSRASEEDKESIHSEGIEA